MSLQDIMNDQPTDPPPTGSSAGKDSKTPMRSWRKKYRKLKLKFDKVMEQSNRLFMEEHREFATVRRLQEGNDQLLEQLLHLNQQKKLPFRYDLRLPADFDINLHLEHPNPPEYFYQATLQALLDRVPHTILRQSLHLPEEMSGDKPIGYLDVSYEEEYLSTLDAQLDDAVLAADFPPALRQPLSRNLPIEKELHLQNPNSVVSWLRRHHPETFIQEKDKELEHKPAKPRGPGKRASMAALLTPGPKSEADVDEDGIPVEVDKPVAGSGRGRRNRDDDAYRPKGGTSGRGKRKREDGEKGAGRGKRAKQSLTGQA